MIQHLELNLHECTHNTHTSISTSVVTIRYLTSYTHWDAASPQWMDRTPGQ